MLLSSPGSRPKWLFGQYSRNQGVAETEPGLPTAQDLLSPVNALPKLNLLLMHITGLDPSWVITVAL